MVSQPFYNFCEDARNEVDSTNSVNWILYFLIKSGHVWGGWVIQNVQTN